MNESHYLECERNLNESDILAALKSMKNEKSPGNDGISKEFYEVFWNHIRIPLMQSINNSFYINELSNSQKQAVIKLIEKKDFSSKDSFSMGLTQNLIVRSLLMSIS